MRRPDASSWRVAISVSYQRRAQTRLVLGVELLRQRPAGNLLPPLLGIELVRVLVLPEEVVATTLVVALRPRATGLRSSSAKPRFLECRLGSTTQDLVRSKILDGLLVAPRERARSTPGISVVHMNDDTAPGASISVECSPSFICVFMSSRIVRSLSRAWAAYSHLDAKPVGPCDNERRVPVLVVGDLLGPRRGQRPSGRGRTPSTARSTSRLSQRGVSGACSSSARCRSAPTSMKTSCSASAS